MPLTPLSREQSQGEEIANSISHGIGLAAALIGTPFLITQATRHGNVGFVVGTSLFSATAIFLYLASTLYHALPVGKTKGVFRADGDRPHVLREIITCYRKGGKVSGPGVYFGDVTLNWGTAMNKALTFKNGQTHVQRYMKPLLERIRSTVRPRSICHACAAGKRVSSRS